MFLVNSSPKPIIKANENLYIDLINVPNTTEINELKKYLLTVSLSLIVSEYAHILRLAITMNMYKIQCMT